MTRGHSGESCTCRTHLARPWNRPEHWSAAEVAVLERDFGRITDELLARRLHRSVVGLRLKAKRIGLRKRGIGFTGREVGQIFGIDASEIGKKWIRRGLLRGRAVVWHSPGRPAFWLIEPSDVERFIREHPEYVDVAKMPDSPYRDLAVVDPWVSLREVHRLTGRNHNAVVAMIAAGELRGARRGTHWFMPLADVSKIRRLAPDHIEESIFRRESVLAVRRARRKGIAA